MAAGPLDGVRVFDMTLWLVGPWAAMQLGALGADVIHIEQPGLDPSALGGGAPPTLDGTSVGYITWNMNKRGLFLDLKSDADRETAYRLLETCDVLLVNMRHGAAERLGMGYEQVRAVNPRVVYTTITGWGEHGPMRDKPGADIQHQYFTGFWSTNGARGGRPEVYRHFTQMDATTGNVAAQAVLMGLLARHRTGEGQRIHVSMLRAAMALQSLRIGEHLASGELHQPLGSAGFAAAPDQAFRCGDGRWIGVSATSEEEWRRLVAALVDSEASGLRPLASDARFARNVDRVRHRDELAALLQEAFAQFPRDYWMLRLDAARVPCGFPLTWDVLRDHAQALENGYIQEVQTSGWGRVQTGGPPWTLERTPARWFGTSRPGEQTGEILDDLALLAAAAPATAD